MVFEGPSLAFGGVGLIAVLSFVLLLYVIYDVIVSEEMLLVEKVTWILLAAGTDFIGILLYFYIVIYRGELIADYTDLESVQESFTVSDVSELERLSRLKEKGDLTEEEFERKKSEIIDEGDEQ